MKSFQTYLLILIVLSAPLVMIAKKSKSKTSSEVCITPQVFEPVIPDRSVLLTDFGAVGDGSEMNTEAFAKAMKTLASKGGGHLIVPPGIWLTGPICFESNIDLHLENGALILFTEDLSEYPLVETSFEGLNMVRCQSPVSAIGKENISITGFGTINGSGNAWRPVKQGKVSPTYWSKLEGKGALGSKGDVWYPNDTIRALNEDGLKDKGWQSLKDDWSYAHDYLRPVLLSLIKCKNVLLENATFENSPSWNIHPLLCENVIVRRITVRNPDYAQNGDGIDAESCRNIHISECTFDVGDDAICIKSGKDRDGRERGVPCENVLIEDCRVYHGHGGFVIGSEMSGGVRNISVKNCLFIGTDCGLRFKSTRGRGGVVEKIYIDGIKMANISGDAIIFDLYYGVKGKPKAEPVTEETPAFRDIHISNTVCCGAARAMFFNGLPEMPLTDIFVDNSSFYTDKGAVLNEIAGLNFKNVKIDNSTGEKITTSNVSNFTIN